MVNVIIKAGDQGDHPGAWKCGDVVAMLPDGQDLGRCVSMDLWKSEGLNPKDFPGGFVVWHVPDAELQDFLHLLKQPHGACPKDGCKRAYTVNWKGAPLNLKAGNHIRSDHLAFRQACSVKAAK